MERTNGSIISQGDGYTKEDVLFTYNEKEKEEQEIYKETAKLIYHPKFIPFYPDLLKGGLTISECIVYGFIEFYLGTNEHGRFYFRDSDLSEILGISENTIGNSVKVLCEKGYIEKSQRMRSGGGTIRFIKIKSSETPKILVSETPKILVSETPKILVSTIYKNNKYIIEGNHEIPKPKSKEDKKIEFEKFWNLYNKKINKDKCLLKWNRLKQNDRDQIFIHVPKYLLTIKDKQYQKHPLTYLNNKSREDEIYSALPDYENVKEFHDGMQSGKIEDIKTWFATRYGDSRRDNYGATKLKRKQSEFYLQI